MELRYDLVSYAIDIRLREPPGTPKVDTLVCEDAALLLDADGRWFGIDFVVSEHDLQPALWWPETLSRQLRERQRIVWSSGEPVTYRQQDMHVDVDEHGVYAVEIMLFLENRSIDFSVVRQAGDRW